MPTSTNLNVYPYFDDFSEDAEFYGILYKPKTSVQARELNQMQSILRHQIEKFGDQIFQVGTIIDGCNFSFYPTYPYVKINDLTVNGQNVLPDSYVGLFAKNNANLQSIIINAALGFQSTDPDLNTLYLSYRNSGNTGTLTSYNAGDVLTVFDSNTGIWNVQINNAGLGFSNTDTAVFTPQLTVQVTSGSFSNGDYVTQPSTGANLQIVSIDLSSYATSGLVLLALKPRNADLSNTSSNGSQWAVASNDTIRNSGNTAVGSVSQVLGLGAAASILTDGSGRIIQVPLTNRGGGYSQLPTVTVFSANNGSGVASVNLASQNYVTQVTVANTTNSVGNGYAFGVSSGTIYQKGLFLKVDTQTIIIDKYDTTPNNVSVGFLSSEQIINSNIDTSLLDNAAGFPNYQAPGADRLKITPQLTVQSANVQGLEDYLPIVSWSEGNPYRQNQATQYSAIGDKMAQELYETEGDFVINEFEVTSRSPFTSATEGTKVSIITNPGSAYVKGYRVFNSTNYSTDIFKTTDTSISNGNFITLNYGNWVRIQEVGGVFQFSTGDTVTFYDTAKTFLSGNFAQTGNTTPQGTALGTARIRSMVHEFGIPGTFNATYKLYLFDITLNQGANFSNIRSVAYSGSFAGIADITLTLDGATNSNIAMLANTDYDYLLFNSGAMVLKNANNVTYNYRTIDQTTTFANTGLLTKSLSTVGETYPYVGSLTTTQLQDLYVVPLSANLIASSNTSGTANVVTTSATITGSSSTWGTDFFAGDYIYLFQNSTVHDVRRVITVSNNDHITLDSNVAFTASNIATYRYFPAFVPVPFGIRTGLSANVSSNGTLLTVNLGMALQGSTSTTTATAINITRTNVSPITKTAARDNFVKILTSNAVNGTTGPWCLGVSDVFRLKRVFMDTSNSISNTSTDVTSYFYIDHKQNEDWLDLGYLYLQPNSPLAIANGNYLLAQFDCFQTSGSGYAITPSYTGANAATIAATDSTQLANLGSSVSSWEIPEVFGSMGQYWDLNNQIDFRPIAANSVTVSTNSAAAPINPAYVLSFGNTANPTNDKKFPLPDSTMSYNMEQYGARIDACFASKTGAIAIARGTPSTTGNVKTPRVPKDSIRLANIYMPPYPILPAVLSAMQAEILTTRIANINYLARRQATKTINIPVNSGTPYDTQPARYTMQQIGALDRRIGALEYYNSLTALQTDMVNQVIPSSVDGSVDRFKFGVFVDDFSTSISQDYTNPSYSARVAASSLTPPVVQWIVTYGSAKAASEPYIDFPIIKQDDASMPIPPVTVANTPVTTTTSNNVVSNPLVNIWALRQDQLSPSAGGQVTLTDSAFIQFANSGTSATLYFYVPATAAVFTGGFIDPDNFTVYQNGNYITDAYSAATSLSAADVASLTSGTIAAQTANWFGSVPLTAGSLTRPATNFVNGSGRLDFTYNPNNGTNFTIVSTRQSMFDHWRWALHYPSAFGVGVIASPTGGAGSSYQGTMIMQPATLLLGLVQQAENNINTDASIGDVNGTNALLGSASTFNAGSNYTQIGSNYSLLYGGVPQLEPVVNKTWQPQSFEVTVYGLQPSTSFEFNVNGVDKRTSATQQFGRHFGDNLLSDATGVLQFTYYFNGNTTDQDIINTFINPTYNSQVTWATAAAGSVSDSIAAGQLTCQVLAAGGSSATFTLQVVEDAEFALGSGAVNATVTQTIVASIPSQGVGWTGMNIVGGS